MIQRWIRRDAGMGRGHAVRRADDQRPGQLGPARCGELLPGFIPHSEVTWSPGAVHGIDTHHSPEHSPRECHTFPGHGDGEESSSTASVWAKRIFAEEDVQTHCE